MNRSGSDDSVDDVRGRRTRIRHLAAVVLAIIMSGPSAAGAAAEVGSPDTLEELTSSAAYDTEHADVLRLYLAFFEREPDPVGAAYWIQQFDDGADLDDLAWGFSNSTEFTTRYGTSLDNRAFLEIVYGNVLGRTPDPEGIDYWVGELDRGLTQHGVVRWVAANDEFIAAHPYRPQFVPFDESMLLTSSDFPTDWTTAFSNAPDEGDRSNCVSRINMPKGAIVGVFSSPDRSVIVQQTTMPFGSLENAEAYLSLVRTYPSTCSPIIAGGIEMAIEPMSMRGVGDSSAAITTDITIAATGATGVQHLVAWRMGRLVTVVSIGGTAVTGPAELVRLVDLAEPRLIAGLR